MIEIKISFGELVDKLTILEIKISKIKDQSKLLKAKNEYELLQKIYKNCVNTNDKQLIDLKMNLLKTNTKLWEVEDKLRILEKNQIFNDEFIQLARSVYFLNDERFENKNSINKHLKSEINEVKEYIEYK